MARRSRAPLRLPRDIAREAAPPPRDGDEVKLRLAVTKEGLGLELGEPARLGVVTVEELVAALPGLSFPLDLSGGVPKFRHRRGKLLRARIAIDREALARFFAAEMAAAIGRERVSCSVLPSGTGAVVGIDAGDAAIAWNVVWSPIGAEARLVIEKARAVGFSAPAHLLALRAMAAAFRTEGERQGSVVRIDDAAALVAREVLVRAGARTPSTEGVAVGGLDTFADVWRVEAARDLAAAALDAEGAQALETAELTADADDALAAGELEIARDRYLAALERAPHHMEIARRLADLDRSHGGRAEAALATLSTAMPAGFSGGLGAELLLAIGDRDGARIAFEHAAEAEPYAPLAAAWLARSAELAEHPVERADVLSRAAARAPTSRDVRWRKLAASLDLGDLHAARAEAEHLEAASRGIDEKVASLLRAAKAFASRGHAEDSARLVERALRYRPASEEAWIALGHALSASGQKPRAADVLARAIAIGEKKRAMRWDAVVALARVLVDLGELPLAIARARSVPANAAELTEARAIEARALARLGDLAAASQAWASVRDAVDRGRVVDEGAAAEWLAEAARFEEEQRGDAAAAKQHLGAALRLRPREKALLAAFRRVAGAAEKRAIAAPVPSPEPLTAGHESASADPARVDALAAKVRANPDDLGSVLALADLLERDGRDLDLVALLSARREEGDERTRRAVTPRLANVLRRLAATARGGGRAAEAELYESMLSALG